MSAYARIILRYLAMFLIAKGVFSPELGDAIASDPDILMLVQVVTGGVVALAAEAWYGIAKRLGWST
jgi:hypothetical protein